MQENPYTYKLLVNKLVASGNPQQVEGVNRVIGDGLEWIPTKGQEGTAISGDIFLGMAERVSHGFNKGEIAEDLNSMFGIPTEEALRRIETALKRI